MDDPWGVSEDHSPLDRFDSACGATDSLPDAAFQTCVLGTFSETGGADSDPVVPPVSVCAICSSFPELPPLDLKSVKPPISLPDCTTACALHKMQDVAVPYVVLGHGTPSERLDTHCVCVSVVSCSSGRPVSELRVDALVEYCKGKTVLPETNIIHRAHLKTIMTRGGFFVTAVQTLWDEDAGAESQFPIILFTVCADDTTFPFIFFWNWRSGQMLNVHPVGEVDMGDHEFGIMRQNPGSCVYLVYTQKESHGDMVQNAFILRICALDAETVKVDSTQVNTDFIKPKSIAFPAGCFRQVKPNVYEFVSLTASFDDDEDSDSDARMDGGPMLGTHHITLPEGSVKTLRYRRLQRKILAAAMKDIEGISPVEYFPYIAFPARAGDGLVDPSDAILFYYNQDTIEEPYFVMNIEDFLVSSPDDDEKSVSEYVTSSKVEANAKVAGSALRAMAPPNFACGLHPDMRLLRPVGDRYSGIFCCLSQPESDGMYLTFVDMSKGTEGRKEEIPRILKRIDVSVGGDSSARLLAVAASRDGCVFVTIAHENGFSVVMCQTPFVDSSLGMASKEDETERLGFIMKSDAIVGTPRIANISGGSKAVGVVWKSFTEST